MEQVAGTRALASGRGIAAVVLASVSLTIAVISACLPPQLPAQAQFIEPVYRMYWVLPAFVLAWAIVTLVRRFSWPAAPTNSASLAPPASVLGRPLVSMPVRAFAVIAPSVVAIGLGLRSLSYTDRWYVGTAAFAALGLPISTIAIALLMQCIWLMDRRGPTAQSVGSR
ncbi:MAG: hypothetical protein R3B68_16370 [Phycisphaerales bacterium]